jgi:hypothetical protein
VYRRCTHQGTNEPTNLRTKAPNWSRRPRAEKPKKCDVQQKNPPSFTVSQHHIWLAGPTNFFGVWRWRRVFGALGVSDFAIAMCNKRGPLCLSSARIWALWNSRLAFLDNPWRSAPGYAWGEEADLRDGGGYCRKSEMIYEMMGDTENLEHT